MDESLSSDKPKINWEQFSEEFGDHLEQIKRGLEQTSGFTSWDDLKQKFKEIDVD